MDISKLIHEKNKQEKILFSAKFVNFLTDFMIVTFIIWFPMILLRFNMNSIDFISGITLFLFTIIMKCLVWKKKALYISGLIFMWVVDCFYIVLAFWRYPHFSTILVRCAVYLFNYGHIELIYNKWLGHLTLILQNTIWCFVPYYTGTITEIPNSSIILAVVGNLALQLILYEHKFTKQYDDIGRKIILETNESNIHNLINAIPEGIIVIDSSHAILMKNTAYDKLIGTENLIELQRINKYHNKIYKKNYNLKEDINQFTLTGKNSIIIGIIQVHDRYLECTSTKIAWKSQPALVLTFRDVSKIINLEKKVSDTSKELSILSGVSHELKTPMNFIINQQQEVINTSNNLSDNSKLLLKQSISTSYYLLSMIKDMIDYSYLKSENLFLTFTRFNIISIMNYCSETLRLIYSSSSFNIIILPRNNEYIKSINQSSINSIWCYSDINKVRQVLMSLLSISLGYNIYRLSNQPEVKIKLIECLQIVKIKIQFNTFSNFFLNPEKTIQNLNNSFKLKISKKLIKQISAKDLKIKVVANNEISLSIILKKNMGDYLIEYSQMDIPDEGDILIPYNAFEIPYNHTQTLIDILIVDDIELNLIILTKIINSLQQNCECGLNHRQYSIHSAISGKVALEMILEQKKKTADIILC